MTGEPCALKGASTVRRGAHRNLGWQQFKALGAYPTKLTGEHDGYEIVSAPLFSQAHPSARLPAEEALLRLL